jgi:hypothetical protein
MKDAAKSNVLGVLSFQPTLTLFGHPKSIAPTYGPYSITSPTLAAASAVRQARAEMPGTAAASVA